MMWIKKCYFGIVFLGIIVGCIHDKTSSPDVTTVTSDRFILHSSPDFRGYFYTGSDEEYHYFSESWNHIIVTSDTLKLFKIPKKLFTVISPKKRHTVNKNITPIIKKNNTQVFGYHKKDTLYLTSK